MHFKTLFYQVFCLFFFLGVTSCSKKNIQKPNELTVSEGFKNPIGFYNSKPTFSWQLPISENIKSQSAYQIIVASSKAVLQNKPDLWDSKKQKSSKSTFVKYQGVDLKSRQRVY